MIKKLQHLSVQTFVRLGVLPILLVAMVIFFGLIEPQFLSTANLVNVARQSTFLILIAIGQMLVIVTAGFDLSVGAIAALVSVFSASVMSQSGIAGGWGLILGGILVGLAIGLISGFLNGVGVAYLKVSPLIVTLGTASVFGGVALIVTGGAPITGIPIIFSETFGSQRLFGIPVVIFITIAIVAVMGVLLTRFRYGRYVYAVGGNEHAARLSGVKVNRTILSVYIFSGVLAAIAGLLLTARVSAGEPNLGGDMALQSITAAVLGGVALKGGEGRLTGVILGALFIGMLSNGMNLIRVSSYYQMVALGVLLVIAVVVDRLRGRVALNMGDKA